jgi:hypothetical protein
MDALGSLIIGGPVVVGIIYGLYLAFRRAPLVFVVVAIGGILLLREVL